MRLGQCKPILSEQPHRSIDHHFCVLSLSLSHSIDCGLTRCAHGGKIKASLSKTLLFFISILLLYTSRGVIFFLLRPSIFCCCCCLLRLLIVQLLYYIKPYIAPAAVERQLDASYHKRILDAPCIFYRV